MKMTKPRSELLLYLYRRDRYDGVVCVGQDNLIARDLVSMGLVSKSNLSKYGFRITDAGRKAIGAEK